ncbi:MAG: hypothetical protein ACYDAD_07710 [Acidimicrobiales bacterium]
MTLGLLRTLLIVAAGGLYLAWLVLWRGVVFSRRLRAPRPGPPTMDLGKETPAIVNCLVHGLVLTPDAVPATLLDLGARGYLGVEEIAPARFTCRLSSRMNPEDLRPYERQVLDLVEAVVDEHGSRPSPPWLRPRRKAR